MDFSKEELAALTDVIADGIEKGTEKIVNKFKREMLFIRVIAAVSAVALIMIPIVLSVNFRF